MSTKTEKSVNIDFFRKQNVQNTEQPHYLVLILLFFSPLLLLLAFLFFHFVDKPVDTSEKLTTEKVEAVKILAEKKLGKLAALTKQDIEVRFLDNGKDNLCTINTKEFNITEYGKGNVLNTCENAINKEVEILKTITK